MKAQLEILFQDQLLVAINKPSGLLVHRSSIDRRGAVKRCKTIPRLPVRP